MRRHRNNVDEILISLVESKLDEMLSSVGAIEPAGRSEPAMISVFDNVAISAGRIIDAIELHHACEAPRDKLNRPQAMEPIYLSIIDRLSQARQVSRERAKPAKLREILLGARSELEAPPMLGRIAQRAKRWGARLHLPLTAASR